jgi:Flp pilus assembly pilin Flp
MKYYLMLRNWAKEQEGQDLTEYVLLVGLIAIVIALVVTTVFTPAITDRFTAWATEIGGWGN